MNVELFLVCDASTDYAGRLNILGVFDTIPVYRFPVVLPRFSAAGRIRVDRKYNGDHEFRIIILDEDLKPVIQPVTNAFNVALDPQTLSLPLNIIGEFHGTQFQRPGAYSVQLSLDDVLVAQVPIFVIQA